MRGEVEMLQNQSEGGKTQQRDLYGDLEKRIAALETLGGVAGAAAGAGAGSASPAAPAAAGEQAAYDAGVRCAQGRQLPQGHRRLQGFRRLPIRRARWRSNAQYWLGEAYYVKRDYAECHRRLPTVRHDVARLAQGAGRAGEARLHAVGAEAAMATRKATLEERACSVSRARMPRASRPSA